MSESNRLLDDIRIASPCTASWDQMTGTDTKRFCGDCQLHVYNISGMRANDAARLVESAEGRICVRLYKRADGTVLTRDCPVGFRSRVRRVTRAAGVALTAAFGIVPVFSWKSDTAAAGQQNGRPESCSPQMLQGGIAPPPVRIKMGIVAPARRGETILVNVRDQNGVKLIGAEVVLTNPRTGEAEFAEQEAPGQYRFDGVRPGVYTLSVTAGGFTNPLPRSVRVTAGKQVTSTFTLESEDIHVTMGKIAAPQG